MKYLLVLGFVLVLFWVWRSGRSGRSGAGGVPPPNRSPTLTEIVACDYCHVHLPRSEALIGSSGTYCSDLHRREAGR